MPFKSKKVIKKTYRPRRKLVTRRNQASTMSRRTAVRGRGEYVVPSVTTKHFSPDYGSRLGSTLGEGVQNLFSAFGLGDYHIKQNSLMSHIDVGTSPPRVMNSFHGEATIFHHREYLGELISGTGSPSVFTLQSYNINPGNPKLFPFLALIASNFQEWEARGILVELKTETSDVVATGGFLGSMFAAVDYDALDQAPINKIQIENYEYASSVKPSFSLIMPIECKPRNDVMTHLYTAINNQYRGGDQRMYDLGVLHIGTQGLPAASASVAEIWISYEIALFKPKVNSVSAIFPSYGYGQHYQLSGPCSAAKPFGLSQLPLHTYGTGVSLSGSKINLPSTNGYWIITLSYVGSDNAAVPVLPAWFTNNPTPFQTVYSSSGSTGSSTRMISPSTAVASFTIIKQQTLYTDGTVPEGTLFVDVDQSSVSVLPTNSYGDLTVNYFPFLTSF